MGPDTLFPDEPKVEICIRPLFPPLSAPLALFPCPSTPDIHFPGPVHLCDPRIFRPTGKRRTCRDQQIRGLFFLSAEKNFEFHEKAVPRNSEIDRRSQRKHLGRPLNIAHDSARQRIRKIDRSIILVDVDIGHVDGGPVTDLSAGAQ